MYKYETIMSVYIPHINSMHSKCDQERWHTCIPHYRHMPLNKYVYHTERMCQQQIFPSNASYMPHAKITHASLGGSMPMYMPYMNSLASNM